MGGHPLMHTIIQCHTIRDTISLRMSRKMYTCPWNVHMLHYRKNADITMLRKYISVSYEMNGRFWQAYYVFLILKLLNG